MGKPWRIPQYGANQEEVKELLGKELPQAGPGGHHAPWWLLRVDRGGAPFPRPACFLHGFFAFLLFGRFPSMISTIKASFKP